MRRQNEARVAELCAATASEQLWQGHFMRMPGAIRATFADQRTYLYQGRVVDAQTHLGVDIASVAQADVRAANRGKVVLAENLGIFGNVVMLDHGQGLFSLYAHLTSIDTQVGAMLEQNQRSEEHTSELQSRSNLVCRLLLEKKNSYNKLIFKT